MSLSTISPSSLIIDVREEAPVSLSKSHSSTSLKSAASTENDALSSPTLCEQNESTDIAGCDAQNGMNSREISLLDIAPTELDVLAALGARASENIECLRINRCRMTGDTFASIVDSLCQFDLPNLHTLDISQNHIGGAQAAYALHKLLTHAPSIRFLYLGWNQLALADLRQLATSPSSGTYKVSYLDLRFNPLSVPQKSKSKSRSLTKTAICNALVSDKWIDGLVAVLPDLTHVLMAQAFIDDQTLTAFMCALTRPKSRIEYIGLEWVNLGSRLTALSTIMNNLAPNLTLHLNLAANNLGDSGAEIISQSGARLTSLTLACNFITERGTSYLARWLPKSGLVALDLSDNYFGDQGIVSLLAIDAANLDTNSFATQIKSLSLNSCCLSDTSLRLLNEGINCKWAPLKNLRILRNNRMTPGAKLNI
ncbi:NACHT, LRR and PYD domains-containing protein 13 [Coemansia spiralis]|uniref:NACHT, LRR and PYD domains-containing protein 13 n=2 Tax=Coemansia TaxID=4863 RepID=A0A9W8L137_9FUNG|nr:hypothetical protein BX070DRAFT_233274 [Coemansia spiralis]KAJ1996313.1 NACHT, LRR and PYD domains-containing protein 13 [Coemansia umbellata]KAJ2625929.1 NACHT, LRR and PYD domains-containing protein 13 [Coemansia sp. RSA 1358]KAJ2680742.1 NACHT, LRR and PYD domains-containing protein 13 [Coemansia spiralis]